MFENGIDIEMLLSTYVIPWGINIAFALLIFFIGSIVAKIAVGITRRLLKRARTDEMLVNFVCAILNAALLLFIIIASLDQLGVNTSSLIALLAAAGLAVGLALQGSLQNFAAGVMLIFFKPFRSGDFVDAAGTAGTIEKIGIFSTTMKTGDNREIIMPNGSIYSSTITNFSAKDTRRIDMVFGIGYDDDIRKARDIMRDIINNDERVLKDPETLIAVSELADNSVNFVVRPWVNSGDYWAVKFALTENIKLAFDENNISIPYPQMDVHVSQT